MDPKDIHVTDWLRLLVGNVPGVFFIELILRAAFFYILIIVCMRLMGKRMASQLSRNEFASLVALGASIGIPLTAPDRGIVPGTISCMIIVMAQRLLSAWFSKNEHVERLTQGVACEMVADGVISANSLKQTNVSRERVLEQLRGEGIRHLGAVKRLYFEANGRFTLIKEEVNKPGISILPEEDPEFKQKQLTAPGTRFCMNCGKENEGEKQCSNCGESVFDEAIIVP